MKKKFFSIVGFLLAICFWFFDALIHLYLYGESAFEIIPSDLNELWMRTVIVLLIFAFGIFADLYSKRKIIVEKQVEAIAIYGSMLGATQHILNNLLQQMQIVRLEAVKSEDFDQEIVKKYDTSIENAVELIKKLSSVENITREDIKKSVYPK